MSALFRLTGTQSRDPAVNSWLDAQSGELGRLAHHWFEQIRRSGPEVREVLHDGCPTGCIADAAFAYVAVYRDHVNLGFFRGSELADPEGLLEGTGRFMRHVKLRQAQENDSAALKQLIQAAYTDMKMRVAAGEP